MERWVRGIFGVSLVCVAACASQAPPPARPAPAPQRVLRGSPLAFCITEGASNSCLLTDDLTTAHAVATSGPRGRILAAFPAGDSGGAIWLRGKSGEELGLRILDRPKGAIRKKLSGVRFTVEAQATRVELEKVVLGSTHTIVEYQNTGSLKAFTADVEAAAAAIEALPRKLRKLAGVTPAALRKRSKSALKLVSKRPLSLRARTTTLDGRHRMLIEIRIEGGRWDPGTRSITVPVAPMNLDIQVLSTYAPLTTRAADKIFHSKARAHFKRLLQQQDADERKVTRAALDGFSFLSALRGYVAGSWQSLNYRGRDTLMTTWLMQPALELAAVEVGLQSVLDRCAVDGQVAHAERRGDQASREHLKAFTRLAGQGKHAAAVEALSRISAPIHDHGMVDDEFMLPVVLASYLADARVTPARAIGFLSGKAMNDRLNMEVLASNLDHVLGKAKAYSDGKLKPTALVSLQPGSKAGDWRDSEGGLGGGRFPASVNLYLVPAALDAIRRILSSPKVNRAALLTAAKKRKLSILTGKDLTKAVAALKKDWEGAAKHFEVTLAPKEIQKRLRAFVKKTPRAEKKLLLSREVAEGIKVKDVIGRGKLPPSLKDGLSFDALALDEAGKPIEVMHADDGFMLLAVDLPLDRLSRSLVKYELPYPLGLTGQFGVHVASPAYSARAADREAFDRASPHGAVVWAWHQGMLQRGLMRQLRKLETLETAEAGALAARVKTVLRRLVAAEERAGVLRCSAAWTAQAVSAGFAPVALDRGAEQSAGKDTVQLFGAVPMAVDFERSALDLLE